MNAMPDSWTMVGLPLDSRLTVVFPGHGRGVLVAFFETIPVADQGVYFVFKPISDDFKSRFAGERLF